MAEELKNLEELLTLVGAVTSEPNYGNLGTGEGEHEEEKEDGGA